MVPLAAARTKKKRKKATAPAEPMAASNDASTAMPMPSTAPATKSKMAGKKKAADPVDLCTMPMWAKTTNGAIHCVVAIAHGQKWVVGNVTTTNGDVADVPSSSCQWY
jgi:hypothetical protein